MAVVFGEALDPEPAAQQDWTELARMGWLYALHVRSAIHRGRTLHADVMLGHWREQVIALAADRAGLKTHHAREAHLLPDDVQAAIARTRSADLSQPELLAALARTGDAYLSELNRHDSRYAGTAQAAWLGAGSVRSPLPKWGLEWLETGGIRWICWALSRVVFGEAEGRLRKSEWFFDRWISQAWHGRGQGFGTSRS